MERQISFDFIEKRQNIEDIKSKRVLSKDLFRSYLGQLHLQDSRVFISLMTINLRLKDIKDFIKLKNFKLFLNDADFIALKQKDQEEANVIVSLLSFITL